MNKPEQELLPPVGAEPDSASGWVRWLFDPAPDRFLLPATGLLIMGLDWLLFPKEAVTLGLAAPVTSVVGFLLGSFGTYQLQRRYGLNTKSAAILKGMLGGVLVGVPFPLAGTMVGAWILASSGIAGLKGRIFRQQVFRK